MKKLARTLAILGTLINVSVAVAQPQKTEQNTQASIALRSTGETHNADYAEGDVILAPKVSTQIGPAQVNYTGIFRRTANTDGETSDLQTFVNKVGVANDTWNLQLGRCSFRQFGDVSTTDNFDNDMSAKGMGRSFTGAFVGYLPVNLTLGVCSSDGEMKWDHGDMLMTSWSHCFDEHLGFQLHGAVTEDHLEKAGLAVEYKPTDSVSLLADAVYSRSGTSTMLLGNFQASENVKLFAGAEVTDSRDDGTSGKAVVGLEGKLGHGFNAVGAVQQSFSSDSSDNNTTVVLGLRFNASRSLF